MKLETYGCSYTNSGRWEPNNISSCDEVPPPLSESDKSRWLGNLIICEMPGINETKSKDVLIIDWDILLPLNIINVPSNNAVIIYIRFPCCCNV